MFDAVKMLRDANPQQYAPRNGAQYPKTQFGQRMMQIAQLIKANVGLEVAFADVLGWDTHVNQGGGTGQLAARLDDFAKSLAAFTQDLGDKMNDVLVLTMSEFGRTARENGTRGTDHGHATAFFVLGGGVTRRKGLRKVARPRAGAAQRRTRSQAHHRLPNRVQRSRGRSTSVHHASRRSSRASMATSATGSDLV